MSVPYISRRLKLLNGKVFAVIPNEGQAVSSITNSRYFPWTFSRTHASHGIPWWTKVKVFNLDVTADGPLFAQSFTGVSLTRVGGGFGDRRDRQVAGEPNWSGGATNGSGDTLGAGLNLFYPTSPVFVGSSGAKAYLATSADIAPVLMLDILISPGGAPVVTSIALTSYPVVDGTEFAGAGSIDGNAFTIDGLANSGTEDIDDASITISTSVTYTF